MKSTKVNNLEKSGLSMSQAQSISNLCNQSAKEIERQLDKINNCSKTIKINDEVHTLQEGHIMPSNIISLIENKGMYHACQAFLMENIRAKENMLQEAKNEEVDINFIEKPIKPISLKPLVLDEVDETFGWSMLSKSEINEYIEVESMASHIGQFIHKEQKLDFLRNELSKIPSIEWFTVKDGEKSPIAINKHHTNEELLKLHENLAAKHRDYEKRVNYYKAKVKNLTTQENARISKLNADAQIEVEKINNENSNLYFNQQNIYNERVQSIKKEFEIKRQENIKNIVSLRIQVDARFKPIIDNFLKNINEPEEDENKN